MIDRISTERRSLNMSRIRGKDTAPERVVRQLLHQMGYRFRLHVAGLPGRPDIVLPKRKSVLFVHGCFWHRHPGCRFARMPATRTDFWGQKFEANVRRDNSAIEALQREGWQVQIVWECETRKDLSALAAKLAAFLGPARAGQSC